MRRLRGYAVACHTAPTVGVTAIMTAFAWSLGWRGGDLALVALTILLGQLSVGWCNDAYDSRLDAHAGRLGKPTVTRDVTPRGLWIGAVTALVAAVILSWLVGGMVGGSFHVLALAMAWLYNLRLSRTVWSWLPYAVAFGSAPLFLSIGLDGQAPPVWMVVAFALAAVSAHLANALPDLETDRAAGLGGLSVRLGTRRATRLCWLLLALGTGVIAVATLGQSPLVAVALTVIFVGAALVSRRRAAGSTSFNGLLLIVAIDVAAIVLVPLI
ncbi:MAG: UbiA family prenyltransferase [Thermoleophilia bacterium]